MSKKKDLVPGIGQAGVVMCPYGFQKSPCLKSGCEMWVEFTYGEGTEDERKVARCAMAWQAILLPELRGAIEKLNSKEKENEPRNQTSSAKKD